MERITLRLEGNEIGLRLDRYLAEKIKGISRSEVQRAIRAGDVTLNGERFSTPSYRLQHGDRITFLLPEKRLLTPAPIDLDILYEDDEIVVLNKPVG